MLVDDDDVLLVEVEEVEVLVLVELVLVEVLLELVEVEVELEEVVVEEELVVVEELEVLVEVEELVVLVEVEVEVEVLVDVDEEVEVQVKSEFPNKYSDIYLYSVIIALTLPAPPDLPYNVRLSCTAKPRNSPPPIAVLYWTAAELSKDRYSLYSPLLYTSI